MWMHSRKWIAADVLSVERAPLPKAKESTLLGRPALPSSALFPLFGFAPSTVELYGGASLAEESAGPLEYEGMGWKYEESDRSRPVAS